MRSWAHMVVVRKIGASLAAVAVYGLLLFVPAWSLLWPRAWVVLALVFVAMVATRLSLRDDSVLGERRQAPLQRGQPRADKLLVVAFLIVFPLYLAFIPLDVFRFHLLGSPGTAASMFGLLFIVAGCAIVGWAFHANAFAAGIVKDQTKRGQVVVDSGPYGVVRHPLYAGVVLITIGVALWLESTAAALAAVIPIVLLVLRVGVEERFLRGRLGGYAAYTARVKWRLIPFVW